MSNIEQYINDCKDKNLRKNTINELTKTCNENISAIGYKRVKLYESYNNTISTNNSYPEIINKYISYLNTMYYRNQFNELNSFTPYFKEYILESVKDNLQNVHINRPANFNNGYANIIDIVNYFLYLIQEFLEPKGLHSLILKPLNMINNICKEYNVNNNFENINIQIKYNIDIYNMVFDLYVDLTKYICVIINNKFWLLNDEIKINNLNMETFIGTFKIPNELLNNTELATIFNLIQMNIEYNLNEKIKTDLYNELKSLTRDVLNDVMDTNPFEKYINFKRSKLMSDYVCLTIFNYNNYSYLNNFGKQLYEYVINRVKNNDFNLNFNVIEIGFHESTDLKNTDICITHALYIKDDKFYIKNVIMYNLPKYNYSLQTKKILYKLNLITPEEYNNTTVTQAKQEYRFDEPQIKHDSVFENNTDTEKNNKNYNKNDDKSQIYWVLTDDFELYKVNPNIEIYSNFIVLEKTIEQDSN